MEYPQGIYLCEDSLMILKVCPELETLVWRNSVYDSNYVTIGMKLLEQAAEHRPKLNNLTLDLGSREDDGILKF